MENTQESFQPSLLREALEEKDVPEMFSDAGAKERLREARREWEEVSRGDEAINPEALREAVFWVAEQLGREPGGADITDPDVLRGLFLEEANEEEAPSWMRENRRKGSTLLYEAIRELADFLEQGAL